MPPKILYFIEHDFNDVQFYLSPDDLLKEAIANGADKNTVENYIGKAVFIPSGLYKGKYHYDGQEDIYFSIDNDTLIGSEWWEE